jgi:putative ABC transport system ATP-binding protein
LVLADEPTGNLDARNARQVLDILYEMTRNAEHTLLVVTHSLEVAKAADRVLVLDDGIIREDGAQLAW